VKTLEDRLQSLSDGTKDIAYVEFCLHQLRKLAKSILLTPTSIAPTVSSPAHLTEPNTSSFQAFHDAALLPKAALGDLQEVNDLSSPIDVPPSPATQGKQREIELFAESGIGKCLVKIISNYSYAPLITELALNVLRDFVLSNSCNDLGYYWFFGTDNKSEGAESPDCIPSLLPNLFDLSSTSVSATLDVLSSFFGTTDISHYLRESTINILLSKLSMILEKFTPFEFVKSVSKYPHQLDLLGISELQVQPYSERWVNIIRDKSVLCLCTLLKSAHEHPKLLGIISESNLTKHILLSLVGNIGVTPASYPETDIHLNTLICIHLLYDQLPAYLRREIALSLCSCLEGLIKESLETIVDLFEHLNGFIPNHLAPNANQLHDSIHRCLIARGYLFSLATSILRRFQVSARNESMSDFEDDVIRKFMEKVVDICTQEEEKRTSSLKNIDNKSSDELQGKILKDSLGVHAVAKALRIGHQRYCTLCTPPAFDSAICYFIEKAQTGGISRFHMQARATETKEAAQIAFQSKNWMEACMYFELSADLVGELGGPTCGLKSSTAECLLQLPEKNARRALDMAQNALQICDPTHSHFEKTKNRIARAEKHIKICNE
jgi:hypothetical protein